MTSLGAESLGANRLNAFTVDVEDYYHVSAFEKHIPRTNWDQFESRVEANTHRLLNLLAQHSVRGTFFVLGWVVDHFPHLIREIHAAGHEVGSHSYWHRLIYEQAPDEFREDLVRSRNAIENLIGQGVAAYRAPSFSVTARSTWALEILVEEGFRIDSSIFPVYHDRYGIPNARVEPHQIETPAGPLWEFPVSVRRFGGVNWPVSGGGYFRLYPLAWTLQSLKQINRSRPFVFYVHPWELDPGQPQLAVASRMSRWRHYVNLGSTEQKLAALLQRFRFAPLGEVIADLENAGSRADASVNDRQRTAAGPQG